MHVVRRQVSHSLHIEPFQQPQGLAQIRPLGPRAALAHRVPPVIHTHRILDQRDVGRQILPAQEPALLDVERLQIFGDVIAKFVSPVEPVVRRLQLLLAATGRNLFLLHHPPQGDRQPGVPDLVPRVQQIQRRPHRLAERPGPVLLQSRNAQVHHRGNRRHLDVVVGNPVLHVPVDRRLRQRRAPLAAERLHFPFRRVVDEHRHLAPNAALAVIRDLECQNSGHGRVRRIPPLLENPDSRLHSFGTPGDDDPCLAYCLPTYLHQNTPFRFAS